MFGSPSATYGFSLASDQESCRPLGRNLRQTKESCSELLQASKGLNIVNCEY